jgi:hypothetical protein
MKEPPFTVEELLRTRRRMRWISQVYAVLLECGSARSCNPITITGFRPGKYLDIDPQSTDVCATPGAGQASSAAASEVFVSVVIPVEHSHAAEVTECPNRGGRRVLGSNSRRNTRR